MLKMICTIAKKAAITTLSIGLLVGFFGQNIVSAADITGGVIAPHLNIAAFHKVHGEEDFKFPKHIKKGAILQALAGKAQFIFINHTAGLKDGDVVVVANDVLRDNAGEFENFGVDCQLTIHVKGKAVSLAGICQFLMLDKNGRQIKHTGIIKRATLQPDQDWVLIHYNEEDGIAIYANEEVGLE